MSGIGTTTPWTLRADFVTQVQAITPSHTEHSSKLWSVASTIDEVEGAEIRTFHVDCLPAEEDPELGWDAAGRSRMFPMRIWTSYAGLGLSRFDDSIISDDGNQLMNKLYTRISPTVGGLLMVYYDGWTEETEEDGPKWGSHDLTVHYMASNTA